MGHNLYWSRKADCTLKILNVIYFREPVAHWKHSGVLKETDQSQWESFPKNSLPLLIFQCTTTEKHYAHSTAEMYKKIRTTGRSLGNLINIGKNS